MTKKTLVIGASLKPDRFAHRAVLDLQGSGYPVRAIGLREGKIGRVQVETGRPAIEDVHTVTMYIGKKKQTQFYEYILSLQPERIIFNPGTENVEFRKMAKESGIETVESCTLMMLFYGNY